jgi:hypothetical protein
MKTAESLSHLAAATVHMACDVIAATFVHVASNRHLCDSCYCLCVVTRPVRNGLFGSILTWKQLHLCRQLFTVWFRDACSCRHRRPTRVLASSAVEGFKKRCGTSWSRSSSASIVTMLRVGRPGLECLHGHDFFYFCHRVQTDSGAHAASYPVGSGGS